jgi:hypothetical protein
MSAIEDAIKAMREDMERNNTIINEKLAVLTNLMEASMKAAAIKNAVAEPVKNNFKADFVVDFMKDPTSWSEVVDITEYTVTEGGLGGTSAGTSAGTSGVRTATEDRAKACYSANTKNEKFVKAVRARFTTAGKK